MFFLKSKGSHGKKSTFPRMCKNRLEPANFKHKNERLYDGSVIHNNGFHSLDSIINIFSYPPPLKIPHGHIWPLGISAYLPPSVPGI